MISSDLNLKGILKIQLTSSSCAHFLISTTPLQTAMMLVISCIDAIEIGMYCKISKYCTYLKVRNVRFASRNFIRYHHSLSLLGIGYQLHYQIGGGLMAVLLLDCLTYWIALVEYLFKSTLLCISSIYPKASRLLTRRIPFLTVKIYQLIDKFYSLFYWITRIFLYTGASIWIWWVLAHNFQAGCSVDLVWTAAISIWLVGANFDHYMR